MIFKENRFAILNIFATGILALLFVPTLEANHAIALTICYRNIRSLLILEGPNHMGNKPKY
jgi:hypothetical protein